MNARSDFFDEQVTGSCGVLSFASYLRHALGETQWSRLDPAIAARFLPHISANNSLVFKGSMQWVICSPLGALIATALKACAILPNRNTRDSRFEFRIGVSNGEIFKQREYDLGDKESFVFRSRFSNRPVLHEEFGGGLGMYLALTVKRNRLMFRDNGYFLRLGRFRLSLPAWLTVGSFDLLHRNIDANRFQVIIRVAHPLLGTLFYQRGVFEKMQGYP